MLDPSLLCRVEFWEVTSNLREIFPLIYVPKNIRDIKDRDFRDFYGGYLHRKKILSVEEVARRSQEAFKSFSWEEYAEQVPEQLMEGFETLRGRLKESYLATPIQNTLLDEFVFLATRSSILSRLKKTFRLFEKFEAIPLLNLERIAPEEWRKSVKGVKNAVSFVNWIASIGGFSVWLGPIVGPLAGTAATGIRLLLIDPGIQLACTNSA